MIAVRRDAFRLALALAAIILLAWLPFSTGSATLLSSASDVPSLYPFGAASTPDSGVHVYKSLDGGAPGWFSEPSLGLAHRLVFDHHVLPVWDPYDGYGTPFAATMQSQPFFPLAFLASIDPGPYSYNAYVLARLFVLAFGCAIFVRLFGGFWPALAAGTCAAFSGYFLIYYDMPHLSTEILLPWSFVAVEAAVRRPGVRSAAGVAVMWLLTILGGMPESTTIAGVTILAYAAFRLLTEGGLRLGRAATIAGGLALGTVAGSIMVLPFLEMMRVGFDQHQEHNVGAIAGLAVDAPTPWSLLTELAPLANGPAWNSVLGGFSGHSGLRGAPGMFVAFFASLGVVAALTRGIRRRPIDGAAIFLAVAVAVCEAKRFGFPLVQWIGALPVLRLVLFPKYLEAVVAVCAACCAGLGVEAVLRGRVKPLTAALVGIGWLAIATALYQSSFSASVSVHFEYVFNALVLCLSILALSTLIAATAGRLIRFARYAIFAVALAEGMAAYLVPMFYVVNQPPSPSRNAFAGAPYTAFLQRNLAETHARTVGVGGALFPNWPGALAIDDVRDLNAIYPERYLKFVDAFVEAAPAPFDDLFDRFTGTRGLDVNSPLVRRWMQLSSVAFVVSPGPLPPPPDPSSILQQLWRQTNPHVPEGLAAAVHPAVATIHGLTENTLFEHPPFSDALYSGVVPLHHPWLVADVTLDPAVWNVGCGGAVTFSMTATNRRGRTIAAMSRTIDPKHRASDRAWNRVALDLSRFAGHDVRIGFATAVATGGPLCSAWAEWGDPRWASRPHATPVAGSIEPLMPAFTDQIHVYRFTGALPRVRLVHSARSAPDGDRALKTLVAADFDVAREAVVEGAAPSLGGRGSGDKITQLENRPEELQLDVVSDGDGLLVQNDTYYPGWCATVDGRPVEIRRTNYLFRGIPIGSGRHHVVIAYRSRAVEAGAALTMFGLAGIALLAFVPAGILGSLKIRRFRAASA